MSLRGELVVECDVPDCHAERVVPASDLLGQDLVALCLRDGWGGHVVTPLATGEIQIPNNAKIARIVPGWTVRWTCPQCRDEGKTA